MLRSGFWGGEGGEGRACSSQSCKHKVYVDIGLDGGDLTIATPNFPTVE